MSTEFLVSEILRLGEILQCPARPHGLHCLSPDAQRDVQTKFREYSIELAERTQRAIDARR